MDNPEKLVALGIQDEDKQNKAKNSSINKHKFHALDMNLHENIILKPRILQLTEIDISPPILMRSQCSTCQRKAHKI